MAENESADERDYVAEMNALIVAETADGPYLPLAVAEHIVAKLDALDPDLIKGWTQLYRVEMVRQAIDKRDRSRRSHTRSTAGRGVFAQAAGQHAAGDSEALHRFLAMPLTVESGHRKRLADLTAADLTYVADVYARRANDNLLMAAFLRVLAKKVRRGTVADHFDEKKLVALWQSHVDSTV